MGNAIFYRNKQYPSAVSGGSGGGGTKIVDELWSGNEQPTISGMSINLAHSISDYDLIAFSVNNTTAYESSLIVSVDELEIGKTYIQAGYYNTCAFFTYTSDTEILIMSAASSDRTNYTKIEGIKFGSGGGSSEINYSTTEQQIGTWIDGKPLYQRSFDLRETTFSDGSWTDNILGTHGSGIKIQTFDGKFGLAGYGDLYGDYNYYRSSNEFFTACIVSDDDDIAVRPNMYAGVAVRGGIVTIRYTKNAD